MQSLDNNEQLVSVWIQYLKAISWLKEDTQGNLVGAFRLWQCKDATIRDGDCFKVARY